MCVSGHIMVENSFVIVLCVCVYYRLARPVLKPNWRRKGTTGMEGSAKVPPIVKVDT